MVKAIVGANWRSMRQGENYRFVCQRIGYRHPFSRRCERRAHDHQRLRPFCAAPSASGVCYQHTMNIIGNGVALDIPKLIAEIKSVTDNGVPAPHIMVSDRAQVMMPYMCCLTPMRRSGWRINNSAPPNPESRRFIRINMRRSASSQRAV